MKIKKINNVLKTRFNRDATVAEINHYMYTKVAKKQREFTKKEMLLYSPVEKEVQQAYKNTILTPIKWGVDYADNITILVNGGMAYTRIVKDRRERSVASQFKRNRAMLEQFYNRHKSNEDTRIPELIKNLLIKHNYIVV